MQYFIGNISRLSQGRQSNSVTQGGYTKKLMYKRISSFINKFEVIVPFQYGFRPGSNTADALLEFTNRIHSSLDIGEISCSVYLDFRKASIVLILTYC